MKIFAISKLILSWILYLYRRLVDAIGMLHSKTPSSMSTDCKPSCQPLAAQPPDELLDGPRLESGITKAAFCRQLNELLRRGLEKQLHNHRSLQLECPC